MKEVIFEWKEMSDSKELYGQRPNPFIAGFIYCLVALLAVAILYACFGKIDVVATASGIVRPNEEVSTVSSMVSGRVTETCYTDGQVVQKGDVLLSVDVSDKEIALEALEKKQAEYMERYTMLEKFLQGIESGKNPFSAEWSSPEYPYFIQFRDYALSLQNAEDTYTYDVEKTRANLQMLERQIQTLQQQSEGLQSYKISVLEGENHSSDYPEYERMYILHRAIIISMENEYQSQREKLQLDCSADSNEYHLQQYQSMVTGYGYLVSSIQKNRSMFPVGDTSVCRLLYDAYCANLDEYERNYQNARETYLYYLNGGSAGDAAKTYLSYDQTILEGYECYQQSVENSVDMFHAGRDSMYYHSLYEEYLEKYESLLATDMTQAEQFRKATLSEIKHSIVQIKASISEKNISLGLTSSNYNIETARTKMESADDAIDTYKTQTLAEYQQVLADYETKLAELQFAMFSAQNKETLLKRLENSYHNSIEQQYYQTLTQIDTSLQSVEAELLSTQSDLKLCEITSQLYQKNTDANGKPLSISIASTQKIEEILSQQTTLAEQLDEIETQIQQIKEQISQGTIVAEQSGIISVSVVLIGGDMISAGMALATIIPLHESEYKVNLYVNNADIAGIEVGDRVRYNLSALPSNQYGTMEGKVTKISTDAILNDGEYSGLFLVESNIAGEKMMDKDGNTGSIAIGMQLEAKIVTQEKTIIRYLLEKINLF